MSCYDLKNRKYLDFLEFLMANGIVENLDFLIWIYSDDVDDLDQTKEEGDPSELRRRKIFLIFMKTNFTRRM